tara:strand:+ start:1258 stop:1869 length:612 start_codon:yes stop_codon:yes gene_type:complete
MLTFITTRMFFLAFTIALNAAFMLSTAFASTVSGFLGSLGVDTVYETMSQRVNKAEQTNRKLDAKAKASKAAVKRINNRVFSRTLKSAGRSVASIPVESVPFWGIAAIVGVTTWEIHDGCRNLDDLNELYTQFGVKPEYPAYQQNCIDYTSEVDSMAASLKAQYNSAEIEAEQWVERASKALTEKCKLLGWCDWSKRGVDLKY